MEDTVFESNGGELNMNEAVEIVVGLIASVICLIIIFVGIALLIGLTVGILALKVIAICLVLQWFNLIPQVIVF